MGLLEGYKKEEGEAVAAAEALASRVTELESQLAASQAEVARLAAQPPVVVKSDLVEVDFSPVLAAIKAIPAPVAPGSGSDAANWDKLWVLLASFQAQLNKATTFMEAIRSRFGF